MLIVQKASLKSVLAVLVLGGLLSGCISAKSPQTAPAQPAATGPADSDNDGVIDSKDDCPETRPGATVDEKGCEVLLRLPSAHFDFDKAEIKPAAIPSLEKAAQTIADRGINKIEIAGHTDSVGSESYNQKLGQQRANSVLEFLIAQGLNPSIFSVVSYGESKPIASNDTEEGRAENRRVEIINLGAK